MKLSIWILQFVTCASAAANFQDWHPAAPGDARSPCPALNSLSNHGILPRDGRNLTLPVLLKAITEGLNVSPEMATTLSKNGLSLSKDPATGAFDLDDLNKHNAIEHDASLSRRDQALGGNSHSFSLETFVETLSFYNGATEIGIKEVAHARWGRVQSSKASNPKFTYTDAQRFPSYFESTAYFQLFMNAAKKTAPVNWIKIFFEQERLPYNEGWRPVNLIDGFSTAPLVLAIAMHTPEKAADASCE